MKISRATGFPLPNKRKKAHPVSRLYLTFYRSRYLWWALGVFGASSIFAIASTSKRLLEDWTLLDWWWIAVIILAPLVAIGVNFARTTKELSSSGKAARPRSVPDIEAFLSTVQLPPELVGAGYVAVQEGEAADLFKTHKFKGWFATSTEVNRALRKASTKEMPVLAAVVNPSSRVLRVPVLSTIVDLLGVRLRWPWFLVRCWKPPLLTGEFNPALIALLPDSTRRSLDNGRKVRLTHDLTLPIATELKLERTDYLSDMFTGYLTGVEVLDPGGAALYDGFMNAFTVDRGKFYLRTLATSSCSNQVGASCMALGVSYGTAPDGLMERIGSLYIVRQAAASNSSANQLVPSGSGSLDWSDVGDGRSHFIEFGWLREMLEETLSRDDLNELLQRGCASTVTVGYARMMHRGGKPEFFGMVVMPRGPSEVGVHRTEKGYTEKCFAQIIRPLTVERLRASIAEFRTNHAHEVSSPLAMNLRLLDEFASDHSVNLEEMIDEAARYYEAPI